MSKLTIDAYSRQAITTLRGDHGLGSELTPTLLSQVFGLVGESGEVAEKFKKCIRDNRGELSEEDKAAIIKELGDILWYVNSVAQLMGSSLEEVAQQNLTKVLSRKDRSAISGSGDDR